MKRLYICLIIICLLLSACGKKTYTDEEFEKMTATELYQLFLDHGLVVPEELSRDLSQEDIALFFKQNFETMRDGGLPFGYYFWHVMGQSAKEIYQELTGAK